MNIYSPAAGVTGPTTGEEIIQQEVPLASGSTAIASPGCGGVDERDIIVKVPERTSPVQQFVKLSISQ